jgi:hypothetical protein
VPTQLGHSTLNVICVVGRDVALYALGVGAAGADPCDQLELPFARPQPSMKVEKTISSI